MRERLGWEAAVRTDPRIEHSSGSLLARLALLVVIVMAMTALVACAELTTAGSETTTVPETLLQESTTLPPATVLDTTTSVSTPTTAAASTVSGESIAYAQSLGGVSHLGEELYFVIGASVRTEEQAKALLEPAKAVGDMQSSFIVQLSDNFDGMRAGYWVVFEAYDGYPSVEDLEFCRRPFPDAYVKRATVMTGDPIPVRPGG